MVALGHMHFLCVPWECFQSIYGPPLRQQLVLAGGRVVNTLSRLSFRIEHSKDIFYRREVFVISCFLFQDNLNSYSVCMMWASHV